MCGAVAVPPRSAAESARIAAYAAAPPRTPCAQAQIPRHAGAGRPRDGSSISHRYTLGSARYGAAPRHGAKAGRKRVFTVIAELGQTTGPARTVRTDPCNGPIRPVLRCPSSEQCRLRACRSRRSRQGGARRGASRSPLEDARACAPLPTAEGRRMGLGQGPGARSRRLAPDARRSARYDHRAAQRDTSSVHPGSRITRTWRL
jgi:hypothetical protein